MKIGYFGALSFHARVLLHSSGECEFETNRRNGTLSLFFSACKLLRAVSETEVNLI